MVDLFFYGTLCDLELLRIVAGRMPDVVDAVLPDHKASFVQNASYPVIQPSSGCEARGIFVRGLTETEITRLNYYEGGFEYTLQTTTIQTKSGEVEAQVYFAACDLPTEGDWDLSIWQDRWGPTVRRAAVDAMRLYGRITAHDLDRIYPSLMSRAASWVTAQRETGQSDMTRAKVTGEEIENLHAGFYQMDAYTVTPQHYDGTPSAPLRREVLVTSDAAIVLPYDPVTDCVLLVEQFRIGPYARGGADVWCLEPIAGRVDAGETAEEAAIREGQEEAGITITHLETVSKNYPSPGLSTEFFHVFVGLADLSGADGGVHGLPTEGENIKSILVPYDAFLAALDAGKYNVGPLVLAGHWLARNRDRLRALA